MAILVSGEAHRVREAEDGDAAFEALASQSFDLAFLDLRMPGQTGFELLDRIRGLGSECAVVIITAQNTLENAIEAMKRGALDYLVKPFALAEVTALASKVLRTRNMEKELRALRREAGVNSGAVAGGERLVGRSTALLEIFKTVGKVSGTDISVLVTGESGTPLLWPPAEPRLCNSRSCHRDERSGARSRRSWVRVFRALCCRAGAGCC